MNLQNLLDYDSSILDGVSVPAPLSKEYMQSSIMIRCGLLIPVYSEPLMMKNAINLWFATHQWNIRHLINIIESEYSPIENTDRYDDWTRSIDRDTTATKNDSLTDTGTTTGSSSGNVSRITAGTSEETAETITDRDTYGTNSETETTSGETDTTAESTTEHSVSAYNATTYQPDSKDTANSSGHEETSGTRTLSGNETGTEDVTTNETRTGETSGTETETRSGSENGSHNRTQTGSGSSSGTDDTKETYTQHMHGNIGVTTNQEMITEEITLVKMFNIYDTIAAMLETDLFLGVY